MERDTIKKLALCEACQNLFGNDMYQEMVVCVDNDPDIDAHTDWQKSCSQKNELNKEIEEIKNKILEFYYRLD